MRAYLRELLGEVERKNRWTLAEALGDRGLERMQRLLNFYTWDAEGISMSVSSRGSWNGGHVRLPQTVVAQQLGFQ
jgi:hypothetical protein